VCVTVGSSGCTVGFSFVGVMQECVGVKQEMCRCNVGHV